MNNLNKIHPVRILIADDQPLQQTMFAAALSELEGVNVAGEAEDGEEVLRMIGEDNFDLLILDISLPKKDGIEVLKTLTDRGKKIPVIVTSNYAREDFESAVLSMGACAFIEKGDIDKIIEAVRECIHAT